MRRLSRLDIRIINAGIIRRTHAAHYGEEDRDALMEVNPSGVFRLSWLAGRQMSERGVGLRDFGAGLPSCRK